MPTPILMPALSPTMEEGKLAKWLVKEGDKVASGDVIAEIETDKATMEVEAVDEGTMGRILVAAGTEGVKVNAPIAVLLAEGEDPSAISAQSTPSGGQVDPAPASAEAPKSKVQAPAPKTSQAETTAPKASEPKSPDTVAASPPLPGRAAPNASGPEERIFASPLARRLAREAGIALARVQGSGPHGRVIKSDIERARADPTAAPPPADRPAPGPAQPGPSATAPAVMPDSEIRQYFVPGSYDVVPHDGMRRIIARRLVQAKQTIPHFYLTVDCKIDGLLETRARLNEKAPKGKDGTPAYKISVNDFVIKALGAALRIVPDANVTWTEEGMLKHRRSDIGVAVSIPGGLITPVVRNVETKGLSIISNEMKDFAARARNRKLKPEEYQGGTTAVSNLGMYGVKDFAAVINPPHATILAVGAGEKRAIVEDDAVVIRSIMSLTLSTDHRAVDGALGAELLQAIKAMIEEPTLMLI